MAKKKRKPCPYCMKVRWMILYLVCMGMIGLLFLQEFINK
ncbi:hypothetical protein MAQ5080_03257 [Marinomonas aquimarina]|uniref:Uncharacterized protein n=1 Tax=Marinomonas aquimarina TaxID=295068 RepID=A0A1A8TNL8_9GAMM|nr:hypothetical protein MAQ5080_03257 [Marinomonas aquimarina]